MKKARHCISILLSTFLFASGVDSVAQIVDISPCRAIEDRLQRFDCYERIEAVDAAAPQADSPRPAAPAQPAIVDSAPVAPASRQTSTLAPPSDQAVATFGARTAAPDARVAKDEDGRMELRDTIASLEQRGPNLWLITLQSGQQWVQMLGKRYPVIAGDEVRIYTSRFGKAYRLTAPRLSGFIQVERVD